MSTSIGTATTSCRPDMLLAPTAECQQTLYECVPPSWLLLIIFYSSLPTSATYTTTLMKRT